MSKKPITWLELIKLKLNEEKAKGKSPSIGDVTPVAKKEWVQIKEGKHPEYTQGKAQTFARKKKGANASVKASASGRKSASARASSSGSSGSSGSPDIHALLSQIKLCGKCKKNVDKLMKKKEMKGGFNQFYDVPPMVSGAQGAVPFPLGNDKGSPVPFAGASSASNSSLIGGGKKRGKKRGKKTQKKQKGGNSGGCFGSCMRGGAPPPLSPLELTDATVTAA